MREGGQSSVKRPEPAGWQTLTLLRSEENPLLAKPVWESPLQGGSSKSSAPPPSHSQSRTKGLQGSMGRYACSPRPNTNQVSCNLDRSHCSSSSRRRSRMSCTARMLSREIQSLAHTAAKKPSWPVSSDSRFDNNPPGGSKPMYLTSVVSMERSARSIKASRQATPAPSECPVQTRPQPEATPSDASDLSKILDSFKTLRASCAQAIIVLCAYKPVDSSKGASFASPGPARPSGSKKAGPAPMSETQSLASMVPRMTITSFLYALSNRTAKGGEVPSPLDFHVAHSRSGSGVPSSFAWAAATRRSAFSFRCHHRSPVTSACLTVGGGFQNSASRTARMKRSGDGTELM
mmetsp:Transcript_105679/g.309085  ORF Transcript_105679/g.309085 Transcript_105679/m.309085 type:complete len:348 (+) Transcript_105679:394-1437(+)